MLKVYSKFILRGWPQRQQETLYPYTRGLLHGWQVWIWISGPAGEKPWDKPWMKTHPRSTGSYPVRTRVRTCYLPFSVARGLVSPTLTTQPQSRYTCFIHMRCYEKDYWRYYAAFRLLKYFKELGLQTSYFWGETIHFFWQFKKQSIYFRQGGKQFIYFHIFLNPPPPPRYKMVRPLKSNEY